MIFKTRAITLHSIQYGETSLVTHLYTERFGRISCIVKGARSRKSRFPATLFQPMTMLDAEIYYKQNRDLQQVKELSCSCLYQSIPFSITKSTITLFLAEVLYKSLHEEESNPPLFDFIFNAFQLFDLQDEGMVNFHLYFLVHYSRFLGIFPANDGRLNASTPSHDLQVFTQLPQEAELAINRILAASVADYAAISLSNQNRTVLLERIMQYYAQHLEGMARIRSFQVLKEVFGSL